MEYNVLYFCVLITSVLGLSSDVRITSLSVPSVVEPSDLLTLGCQYNMGGEELHSVKWYKDEQEFFRYMPRQQPHTLSFPVAGVHPDSSRPPQCSVSQCSVHLGRLTTAHSSGKYQCEVSSEAPKFHVAFKAAALTVAAQGTQPEVLGLRPLYSHADLVHVNCSVSQADPAPNLTWYINDVPADVVTSQRTSPPDTHGLVSVWRDLRFHAERRHFPAPERLLHVKCVATQPGVPGSKRESSVMTARLHDPAAAAATANHQQLEWLYGTASIQPFQRGILFCLILPIFYWR